MISDTVGLPQIVALIILIQRGAEELYSARNTQALIDCGRKRSRPIVLSRRRHDAPCVDRKSLLPDTGNRGRIVSVGRGLHCASGCALLGNRNARPVLDAPHLYARQCAGRPARTLSIRPPSQLRGYDCRDVSLADGLRRPGAWHDHGRSLDRRSGLQGQARGRSTFGQTARAFRAKS